MTELLAPAGNMEALKAAVFEGANAVYLAGNNFGARAYAKNFDDENLEKAIKYAHLHNVAVHVTVNTIVDDDEFDALKKYLKFLEEIGADAVLVQDLGVAKLAGEVAPTLPLHASTQMTVHNLDGVRALENLGFSRVVLSRELSLAEIKHIVENTNTEIEIFMHGALCVCYSGACLMSSMIGGRSGNRGRCAQPCRLPYTLVNANDADMLQGKAGEYLLSPRDLATIDILPELIKTGVTSFKIEGRMKSPEYVATVVRVYRAAMDRALSGDFFVKDDEKKDLRQIFNRDFTTAYLTENYPGKDFVSDKKPNNRGLLVGRVVKYENNLATVKLSSDVQKGDIIEFWVKVGGRVAVTLDKIFDANDNEIFGAKVGDIVKFYVGARIRANDRAFKVRDAKLTENAKIAYEDIKRIDVAAEVTAKVGEPLTVTFTDNFGNIGKGSTDFITEVARNRPLTEDTLYKQINRLGDTAFSLKNLKTNITGEVMTPISEINEARRKATAALEKNRIAAFNLPNRVSKNFYINNVCKNVVDNKNKLLARADNLESARAAFDGGASGVIFGGETYNHRSIEADEYVKIAEFARRRAAGVYFSSPRIVKFDEESYFIKYLRLFEKIKPAGIYLQNIGQILKAKEETTLPLFTDFSLISYNSYALEFLKNYGVSGATLSEELTLEQIKKLAKKAPLTTETIIFGRAELMVSNYCVLGTFLGGRGENECAGACKKRYFLKDRMGEKFPVITDEYCRMHILNAKIRSMLPYMHELKNLPMRLRIDGRYETPQKLYEIIKAHKKAENLDEEAARELEATLFNAKDITRGHFFRGVL